MAFNNLAIASGPDSETYTPYQLLAGDTPPVATTDDVLLAGQGILLQNTVLGRVTASGFLKVHTTAASDGSQLPVGILNYDVDTTGSNKRAAIYRAGCFNVRALIFDPTLTTDDLKLAVFQNHPSILTKKLFWSGNTAHGTK